MQKEELLELVNEVYRCRCEMQNVEVKSAKEGCPTKLYDTLSSFSNQDGGGTIIFGIDEKNGFEISGVYNAQDLQHRVAEQCKQMQPVVRPLFTVCDVNGKIVVSAEIPGVEVTSRPVYYKGIGRIKGSYIRVGESDESMSDYEIYSYDAYHRRIRDDIRIAELADVSHLDMNLINIYVDLLKTNRINISRLEDSEILQLMGVLKDNKPTLSGVLCFSKYPQATFPQLCINAVVVPGTQMGETGIDGVRFSDNKKIEGTIAEMLDEAVLFLKRNMRQKTILDSDGKRKDKTEYPIIAVREAILNALMHRDYSIHTEGTPVRMIMYNDRLEIINEGGLYGKVTMDNFGKIHADTRNQTLANILETLNIAENRYSGIPTMRLEMKKSNLPEPIFENKRGSFILTFKNDYAEKVYEVPAEYTTLIDFCKIPRSRQEIADYLGKTQYYTMKTVIMPLVEEGRLQMTIKDKPKSKRQRFVAG